MNWEPLRLFTGASNHYEIALKDPAISKIMYVKQPRRVKAFEAVVDDQIKRILRLDRKGRSASGRPPSYKRK